MPGDDREFNGGISRGVPVARMGPMHECYSATTHDGDVIGGPFAVGYEVSLLAFGLWCFPKTDFLELVESVGRARFATARGRRRTSRNGHRVGAKTLGNMCLHFVVERPVHPGISALRMFRSEERRVGKECRSRGSPYH